MLYTKAELDKKSGPELKKLAVETHGLDIDGVTKKSELVELLLEVPEPDEDELEEELEEEDEVEAEVEEELDEEELDEELEEDDIDEEPVAKPAAKKSSKASTPAKAPAKAKKGAAADDEDTLAAKQVATLLSTEAKTLRQFLRSEASTFEAVGSGGRYEFTKGDVPKIKAEFDAWKSAHASRGSKRGATAGKKAAEVEILEEVEEIEELEIEELDDEIDEEELELEDEE